MPAVGIIFGSELQLQWGTAFLPFVVPAAMELVPFDTWLRVRMTFALKAFMALQACLLVLSYATSQQGWMRSKIITGALSSRRPSLNRWRLLRGRPWADPSALSSVMPPLQVPWRCNCPSGRWS